MKTDKNKDIFSSKLSEMCERASLRHIPQFTKFLNTQEQADAAFIIGKPAGLKILFFGGREDAERKILGILPEYCDEEDTGIFPIRAIEVKGSGYRIFTHRDFLGSVLALGITRELVGDIIVSKDQYSAFLFLQESILPFLLVQFQSVANDKVTCREIALDEVSGAENEYEELYDTVSSLRLDAVVCAAANLSRETAQQLILSGRVTVNHRETLEKDKMVAENDLISIRGKGRYLLAAIGSVNKKGRTGIRLRRFR